MTYRNLMLTMLLGGLWHGASWNFVIWGGYHGALLGLERVFGRKHFQESPHWLLYPFRAVFTFVLVCVGWVFFRAATLRDSVYVIQQMFSWHGKGILIPVWLGCVLAVSLVIALLEERSEWIERLAQRSRVGLRRRGGDAAFLGRADRRDGESHPVRLLPVLSGNILRSPVSIRTCSNNRFSSITPAREKPRPLRHL